MPAGPARIEARGWGWRHAGRRRSAVRDVDLVIEPGERVLLLGASGSGKSTLLHGLAGVLGGSEEGEASGRLLVDGRDAADARGRTGLVLQDPGAQLVMSRLGDDVAFGAENLGVPPGEIAGRVREALDAVGLDLPLDRPTSALSGGQQQRLALAGVLAMRPGALLLDEPTANLDPDGVAEVRDAVARVLDATGATLVVIEHRVDVWASIVQRVVVLGDGGVLADGPTERVLADEAGVLAAAGVWLPGRTPETAPPPAAGTGPELLVAEGLSVARVAGQPLRGGIDLTVSAGDALAITGPNGVGKSTLALTLAGLLRPDAGTLEARGPLAAGVRHPEPIRWKPRDLLTRIGTVFQSPAHQFLRATVREELELGPRALRQPPAEREARAEGILERLGLLRLAEANPFTLSGGEQRRLSVATAIATAPQVLVLDEPTFGQDANTWAVLVELLAELRAAGTSVVAVTHDREFVRATGSREHRLAAARSGVPA
ncbi:ABC transporter ATP-binding protein [Agromyces seonyuensis]|uniref:ATP-binding cassette domain-containing protein n=1 Tax=Agromyces seonyuensis TaxID=2662446 RepID=A0A6I4NXY7_9MICO|nr:ATP-binding cassette domain-containing protein [Agromyces seonyuensis]MWB97385.1 ATP-binding cassette domain-containing protein [Agromyces seonyuensis]